MHSVYIYTHTNYKHMKHLYIQECIKMSLIPAMDK